MGTIGAGFSMSLDGYVADAEDATTEVFSWYAKEQPHREPDDTNQPAGGGSPPLGAILCGRRTFDVAGGWNGKHPLDVPVIVLTHHQPQGWNDDGKPFTFITRGFADALAKAKEIAGTNSVGVVGPDVVGQCIAADELDELGINLVPVLLGSGIPMFRGSLPHPKKLRQVTAKEGNGVVNLLYEFGE